MWYRNTKIHFNLYSLHWADTSVLFIVLENIQTCFWEDIKTQQFLEVQADQFSEFLMRLENLKSNEIGSGIERGKKAQSWLGMAGLGTIVSCVYILGWRGICYTAVPDTGLFYNCRVVQGRHWNIPYLYSLPSLLNQDFPAIPFDLTQESCMLSMKRKNLELLY